MSDSANGDEYNWLRAIASEPAGDNTAGAKPHGAAPDDNPLPFAAPGGMPALPRYGGADGANAANGVNAKTSLAPASSPAAEPVAASDSVVSDLPTVRVSAAPAPTPAAPSVSDLPTKRMPSADASSAPAPPAQDVSDLPTQRVKATLPPMASMTPAQAIPATPAAPATQRLHRLLVIAAGAVVGSLVGASVVLLIATLSLGLAPQAPTTTKGVYHQPLTAPAAGWPESGACRFTASGYEVSGPSACFYEGRDVRDATVAVTMTRTSGSDDISAGLAFRRVGPDAFYTFEIDGAGNWAVYKRGTVLQQGVSITIKTDKGAKNTLQVQMKGDHFIFSINGEQVAQADDAEFATGKVGLTGYTGLKVVYTDFTITPL
jgi:hypothetical protein